MDLIRFYRSPKLTAVLTVVQIVAIPILLKVSIEGQNALWRWALILNLALLLMKIDSALHKRRIKRKVRKEVGEMLSGFVLIYWPPPSQEDNEKKEKGPSPSE